MAKNVVGLFDSISDAQGAVQDLSQAGFTSNNVTFIQRASSQLHGIFGQLGIPQNDAATYLEGVQNGGGLIVVQQLGDDDADRVVDILNRHNLVDTSNRSHSSRQVSGGTMQDIEVSTSTSSTSTRSNRYDGGEMVIPIIEEEIHVGKREVEGGGVRVETTIEELPVSEQVTLRQEEVHVERRAVNQSINPSEFDSLVQTGTFEVREREEQAVVSKDARIVEEVVINKDTQERTATIEDTVRRTDVNVEELSTQNRASAVTEISNTSSGATGSASTKSKKRGKKRGRK